MANLSDYFNLQKLSFDESYLYRTIKPNLSHAEYFIAYYRFLSIEVKSITEIAQMFNTTPITIKKLEQDIIAKCQELLKKSSTAEITNPINYQPINPDISLAFLYLQPTLTSIENKLLKILIYDTYKYDKNELAAILNITSSELDALYNEVIRKIKIITKQDEFQTFSNIMKSHYQLSVLEPDTPIDYNPALINDFLSKTSIIELKDLIKRLNIPCSLNTISNIETIKKMQNNYYMSPQELEQELNVEYFGYTTISQFLSPDLLYSTYLANINEFKEDEKNYLECCFFKTRPAADAHYNNERMYRYVYTVEKLESMYLGTFKNSFDREKYLSVRDRLLEITTAKRIELMDVYFGVNQKSHTIAEMAELYHISNRAVIDPLFDAIEQAKKVYMSKNKGINIDKSIYVPYLKDNMCDLTAETHLVLTYYLVGDLSYEEIKNKTGLAKKRISNIITDGLRKIDYYRFGISKPFRITEDELKSYYNYRKKLSDLEKAILYAKFIEQIDNDAIAKKFNLDKKRVNIIIKDFYDKYYLYQIKDVTITEDEIIEDYNKQISESVLSFEEKRFVELYYIKKLPSDEIKSIMHFDVYKIYRFKTGIINKIKGKHIGLLNPELLIIPRSELIELLKDPNLPISQKERDIICHLFEIDGYPYKSLEELASMYENEKHTILRRYQRAIINIQKYLNAEIDGFLNYEKDIKPYLRYFGLFERNIIIDYYQNNLTYQDLGQKYSLTFSQINGIMENLSFELYCLMHDSPSLRLDFDYYLSIKDNPDIPYYGDIETAKQIFELYYGMDGKKRYNSTEIINLGYPLKESAISKLINHLTLCIIKYQLGFRKEKEFSINEVLDYYNKHNQEFSPSKKAIYKRHLNRVQDFVQYKNRTNHELIFDLIKEHYKKYIRLRRLSKEDAINLIKNGKLTDSTKASLLHYFNMSLLDIYSEEEQKDIYDLLLQMHLKIILDPNLNNDTQRKRIEG